MKINNIEIEWTGHAGFRIKLANKIIFIDPFQLSENAAVPADIILITHSHYDHCSIADLQKIIKDGTVILAPADCQSAVAKIDKKIEIILVNPEGEYKMNNITIFAVPAYNINKQFHQKSEGWLGYILRTDKTIIYHAGDTDKIPEMQKLSGYGKKENSFIALLPIGGKFTMSADEAADAAAEIKASIAIPMHYGSIIGSPGDAIKFSELCREKGIQAEILEKI